MFYKSLSNFRSYIYYGIRIGSNTNRTFNNLFKFNNYNNNNNIRFISNNFNKRQQNNYHQQEQQQQQQKQQQQKNDLLKKLKIRSTLYYVIAAGVLFIGCTYAAVPLYRLFCQAYSYGGTVQHGGDNVENMKTIKDRVISIKFNADVSSSMRWNFRPQQYEIKVVPGETALAFYTAKNPADTPVIGISTYNVVPFEAGQYFNKIQCFCFEEQQLNPHEEVDMPVFFYIDPEFVDDPKMEFVDEIILSYTFFESKPGMNLPIPNYLRGHSK